MGIAATNFSAARTAENFKAWYAEAPKEAATYLKTVAVKTGNVTALNDLDKLEAAPPADPGAAVAGVYAQVDAAALGALQAARVDTMGWEAKGPPKEPPTVTGRLSMVNGQPTLTTSAGVFTVRSVNPVGANDVSAFANRVVTVKGWPDANWQPGANAQATLLAEEFAPGSSGEFVTGRVVVSNGEVTINVRPDKQVKVTNPELKALLANFDKLGMVLPGDPKLNGTEWVYDQKPDNYYILAGFNNAMNPTATGDQMNFNLQLAHGKSLACDLPKVSWDSCTRQQRHYFFGHIEGTQFKAAGVTPTAGSWSGAPTFQRGNETSRFMEYAVPVEAPAFTADESKFAL